MTTLPPIDPHDQPRADAIPGEASRVLTPEEVRDMQHEIEDRAMEQGLDFDPVVFETVNAKEMNIIAAKGGYPVRYPHWRWAMEYQKLQKGYEFGQGKIYELVINNNPVYAYMMGANSALEQKLVMTHVYGHADFFKNNMFFAHTDRNMLDEMGNHAARVRHHMDREGVEAVETWIDICRSIENLIGHFPKTPRLPSATGANPAPLKRPERDVLRFLIEHAPIEDWQRDILGIVREEAYFFLPQAQTKIMNEGWASFWHTRLMAEEMILPREVVEYCDCHSGVVAALPGNLNPYKVGVELFRELERSEGRERIFDIRRTHNDVMFLDEFLTLEFAERHRLLPPAEEILSRAEQEQRFGDFKESVLAQLANGGQPRIDLVAVNYNQSGELFLMHHMDGPELDIQRATDTMKNLSLIWGAPVNVQTVIDDEQKVLRV